MSYLSEIQPAPRAFFKKDRPRVIDQYIHYFGDHAGDRSIVDPCGEAFLESLDSAKGRARTFTAEVAS